MSCWSIVAGRDACFARGAIFGVLERSESVSVSGAASLSLLFASQRPVVSTSCWSLLAGLGRDLPFLVGRSGSGSVFRFFPLETVVLVFVTFALPFLLPDSHCSQSY